MALYQLKTCSSNLHMQRAIFDLSMAYHCIPAFCLVSSACFYISNRTMGWYPCDSDLGPEAKPCHHRKLTQNSIWSLASDWTVCKQMVREMMPREKTARYDSTGWAFLFQAGPTVWQHTTLDLPAHAYHEVKLSDYHSIFAILEIIAFRNCTYWSSTLCLTIGAV